MTAALLVTIEAARHYPQAEIAAAYFPALFLARGAPIAEQIAAFADAGHPHYEHRPKPSALRQWADKIGTAIDSSSLRTVLALIDSGPTQLADPTHADPQSFYPSVARHHDERVRWAALVARTGAARQRDITLDAKSLRRWARRHLLSNGGSTGWSPRLIQQLDMADPACLDALAMLWSTQPRDRDLRHRINNVLDGWFIHHANKGARPISAPQTHRRIVGATLAKRAHKAVDEYAKRHGQWGCGRDHDFLVYSLLPHLAVTHGGTTISADRSRSFQSFDRSAMLDALEHFVDWAQSKSGTDTSEAAASLIAACDMYLFADAGNEVRFGAQRIRVPALPQGCSISPLVEAITIAYAMRNRTDGKGVATITAHDDLQMTIQRDIPPALALPDTSHVGGTYNVTKSIAVGAHAEQAVQQQLAATADYSATVWGRPVGRLQHWIHTRWYPTWIGRIAALRNLYAIDTDIAVGAMHRCGGPGAASRHWLRAVPVNHITDQVLTQLAQLDDAWVSLWIHAAGHDPSVVTAHQRDIIRKRIYNTPGSDEPTIGQWSIVTIAKACAAQGTSVAIVPLLRVAQERGFDPRPWGRALGLTTLHQGLPLTLHNANIAAINKEAAQRADSAMQALAHTTPTTTFWAEALNPTQHRGYDRMGHFKPSNIAPYAVARQLGLSVWPAILGPHAVPPTSCTLCGAASHIDVGGGAANQGSQGIFDMRPYELPTQVLDPYGEHISCCVGLPAYVGAKARHDAIARCAPIIASSCGINAMYHDRPLYGGQRPADWLEIGPDRRIAPDGICCDFTIATGGIKQAQEATKHKYKQYRAEINAAGRHVLNVVAVATIGHYHGETEATLARWAKQLAASRACAKMPKGAPIREIRAIFARAVAGAIVAQARTYAQLTATAALAGPRHLFPPNKRCRIDPHVNQQLSNLAIGLTAYQQLHHEHHHQSQQQLQQQHPLPTHHRHHIHPSDQQSCNHDCIRIQPSNNNIDTPTITRTSAPHPLSAIDDLNAAAVADVHVGHHAGNPPPA